MATKKKLINYKPRYDPGDIVYAISTYHTADGEPEDAQNHCRIFKVIVDSINIDNEGVNYYFKEWGDSVPEIEVSSDKNELVKRLLNLWKI